jgi:ATP-binding cassette subfamily B protein
VPDRGKILIGNIDIQDLSTSMLRKKIAVVPQNIDLFEGDFIFNIGLGDNEPDLDRIHEICHRLGLQPFIEQLPQRYQTMIREQGLNLSGGQRQRIGIARAMYRDPQILILDEATSGLDTPAESKVLDAIRWFWDQKKTIIVVAHRVSTIRQCDSVIFLNQATESVSEMTTG